MNNRRRSAWMRRNQEAPPALVASSVTTYSHISGSAKYAGITYDPGTDLLYCAPRNQNQVLQIDPLDGSSSLIGSSYSGSNKYTGIVRHPNGYIYCTPRVSQRILRIDPVSKLTALVGSITFDGFGGLLLPSGEICCLPYGNNYLYIYDPLTDTHRTVTAVSGIVAAVLTQNNLVLLFPESGNMRYYDIAANAVYSTSLTTTGTYGAVSLPSGKIMAHNATTQKIQIIDPTDLSDFDSKIDFNPIASAQISVGLAVYPNSDIFSITTVNRACDSNQSGTNIQTSFGGSMVNYGLTLDGGGSVWGCPYNGNLIAKFSKSGMPTPTPDMLNFPSDLADLPASLYNTYCNHSM